VVLLIFILLLPASRLLAEELELPDPLRTRSGKVVDSVQLWQTERRPEILELFRENIYGRMPVQRPKNLRFFVTEPSREAMEGQAVHRQIDISYRGPGGQGTIQLVLFLPKAAPKPVPCFLLICNRGLENMDPTRKVKSPFWPAELIVQRGYAAAVFHYGDVAPDRKDAWTNGVFRIFEDPDKRRPDSWGAIAAWAWGASRALDYLETDRDIDARRVALVGHSRGGKAALWAGAEDERFALIVSNESGSTGAAIARGKKGEKIQDINRGFPHWFCDNYKKFNDREKDLPVDQHLLAALIAPRPLYIASATEDSWADPKHEFLAGVHAEPVYRLFKLPGLGTSTMPSPESPIQTGFIAYHLRTGIHNLTEYDWARFMDFADRHLVAK
jgi:hypothetical protein